ncbi:deleted in malignant brain tumors 1 protein-like [Magallana gigas]|uniref:deleted in malignant brain tumors 1 protein-like n=1 Tax=Magallana gigas TaxID=29159 RepID=UPI00334053AB
MYTIIRLVGGDTESEGRLEVYKFGQWGTVCDYSPNDKLAAVVCRSLGFSWNTSEVYGHAVYGPGSGPIWLDDVNCEGSEINIDECQHQMWGSHNCNHGNDVSINCIPNDTIIRLVGGDTESEGRLEVYKFGQWGKVCGDSVTDKLAAVVCRSLGFPWNTSEVYGNAVYGRGSGPIWLDDVNCEGSEISIDECQHREWGTHNCNHGEDVSINCSPNDTVVRLVGGAAKYEGRVEVHKFGKWRALSGYWINRKFASVVCRSLGLPWYTSEAYRRYAVYEPGRVGLNNINCVGNETNIDKCSHRGWRLYSSFNYFSSAYVNCLPGYDTVRLVGGPTKYEGRLEVYYNETWGTVCEDELNANISTVVCRTLGLPWNTSEVYGGAVYGQGSGPIWLDDVDCVGKETKIQYCTHRGWGSHNCDHSKDVSISCLPPNETVRLIGGATRYEGRLEVYRHGQWGTVCDDKINEKVSAVVCQTLDLPWTTSEVYEGAVYGQGSGPIWLDDVDCVGDEPKIQDCTHRGWGLHNCDHSKDVSISCLPANETVRLVGGATQYEGRLEVYRHGQWGTVCDDKINEKVSAVVCRTLGLPWTTSEVYGGAVYGQGSGPIWLDDVKCEGTEARIQDCQHDTWGTNNCDHTEDASVNCLPSRGGISFHRFFFQFTIHYNDI